ncbi:MAG: class I SAM-dependent methyltransferase [Phycisphaerae bacterium]|nr:class I SAM-dependent methyltransferase [Phycisphaerae bacterium]
MSGLSLRQFVVDQHCVPWKLRLAVRRMVPWQYRRRLLHGRVNLNTPAAMDQRYRSQGTDFRSMENLYGRLLPLLPSQGRLLDAGCGIAVLLRTIRQRYPQLELHGVDFSPVAVERTREYGFAAQVAVLPDLPYDDGCFDAVTCTEVLEHLDDPAAAVRSFARVLRAGGWLIVSAPQDLDPDHCLEHVQDFDEPALRGCLSQTGLDLVHLESVEREPHRKPGVSWLAVAVKVGSDADRR